jgi:hypothetical protein
MNRTGSGNRGAQRGAHLPRLILAGACIVTSLLVQGCDTSALLVVGTPFVVQGTMTVNSHSGTCLIWMGDNGETYYLYQDPLLDTGIFDQITTPGVTSRLVVVTRSDLTSPCAVDEVVQVQEVIEVVQ